MDSDNSQQTTIRVIIKTPNQAYKDQTVDGVHLTWTVKELKTHLSAVYPSRPPVSGQRLIYAGKLLLDHLPLEDLFKQKGCNHQPQMCDVHHREYSEGEKSGVEIAFKIDVTPSLHLVCALGNQHQELGARSKTRVTEQVQPSSSSSGTPGLRQRRQTSPSLPPASAQTHTPGNPPSPAMPGAQQMSQPAFPSYSLYSPQQLLWLQHLYAQQYYMQYHAALAAARSDSSTPASTVGQYPPVPAHHLPVPAPLGNQNPINDLPVNPNPVQDGAFLNPAEANNNNLRLNAQGGAVVEDEEDVEHDWLDWMYSAARVGVLLMIVYFNSNLSRFLLVMGTLLLMYLHTAGWFPFRRQARVREPNHQQPPEVQPNQQNDNQNPNQAGEPAEGRPAAPPEASEGLPAAVLVPPHRASLMWTAWVFFKSFFSSLIPEGPQAMVN